MREISSVFAGMLELVFLKVSLWNSVVFKMVY